MRKAYTKELLHRMAANDDKEAFNVFFNLYYTKLIRFALFFVPTRQYAEDVVSDVLIRLLQQRSQLCNIENFEGYLFLSVKNQALSSLKRASSRMSYHTVDVEGGVYTEPANPESTLLDDELRTLICQTVENLPPRRRMIYKMIKDDGLKYKEVASLLDISQKTVENHLDLAIREVRQVVTRYLEGKQVKPLLQKVIQSVAFLCLFAS